MEHIKLKSIIRIIFLVIYYCILCCIYVFWISPRYQYVGLTSEYSFFSIVISFAFAVLLSVFAEISLLKGGANHFIMMLLIFLYFIPASVFYGVGKNDLKFILFVMIYATEMMLLNAFLPISQKKIKMKERSNLFEGTLVALSIVAVAVSGYYTGFRISFNLSEFYELRYEVRELMLPSVIRYISSWSRTLLPIGLIYALTKKKTWLAVIISVSSIFAFSFNGKKSVLFMVLLTILVFLFYKRVWYERFPQLACLFSLSALFENFIRGGESFVAKYIVRRLLFIPPYLAWAYVDFFSDHELDYLKSSVMRWFGAESIYKESISRMIGRLYYATSGGAAVNGNTGLCGDAFSNFGWYSLLLYPAIDILYFKIVTKYISDFDEKVQLIICLTIAYTFLSGTFFSVMLTNGLLFLIFMLLLLPKKTDETDLIRLCDLN